MQPPLESLSIAINLLTNSDFKNGLNGWVSNPCMLQISTSPPLITPSVPRNLNTF